MEQGQQLGRFEILAPLGAGGMGEVYRARDPQLGRDVAIKILPAELALDAARLARLEREASALAAVNHPNVASIYELGEHNGSRFLVLEVVEGETLSQRLQGGPLRVDAALEIAQQVAGGLEAAHARGVIHRDLKPVNVMLTADGLVKVLDFGLAKSIVNRESLPAERSNTETEVGTVLGTAPYMSPEQARGEPATRQSDIWSFGVLLYELLSGVSPFERPSRPETLARVLVANPDLDALPIDLPPIVTRVIRRCLEKEPQRRLRDIGDVRIDIEDALNEWRQPAAALVSQPRSNWQLAVGAAIAAAVVVAATVWVVGGNPFAKSSAGPALRLALPNLGAGTILPFGLRTIAIADSGSHVVFTTIDGVWVYSLSDENSHSIDTYAHSPFVAPRGDRIGFFDIGNNRLVTVPFEGGAAQTLAESTERHLGADWGVDGAIVFAMTSGLYAVPADGSAPARLLAKPDHDSGELFYAWPEMLPGGSGAVFTIVPLESANAQPTLAIIDLNTGEIAPLLPAAATARFTAENRLLFVRDNALMTVGFDAEARTASGVPVELSGVTVAVAPDTAAAEYDVARNGTLIHIASLPAPDAGIFELYWKDRNGNEELLPLPPARYTYPRVSPDGTRISFEDRNAGGNRDIWIYDVARQSTSRFTTGPTEDMLAVWSADSSRIYFSSNRAGDFDIYSQPSDGSTDARVELQRPVFETPSFLVPGSTDLVVFEEFSNISIADLADKRVRPLLHRESIDVAYDLSPDGAWLLYVSDEAGPGWEVYLRRFDDLMSRRIQVSVNGGTHPMWGPPGSNELFYTSLDGELMAVAVELDPELRLGTPVKLFDTIRPPRGLSGRPYDVSRTDGRFLLTRFARNQAMRPGQGTVSVVLNWFGELEAQLAAQ